MKIALTGHTVALGKIIFENNPDAVGFSRSNCHLTIDEIK